MENVFNEPVDLRKTVQRLMERDGISEEEAKKTVGIGQGLPKLKCDYGVALKKCMAASAGNITYTRDFTDEQWEDPSSCIPIPKKGNLFVTLRAHHCPLTQIKFNLLKEPELKKLLGPIYTPEKVVYTMKELALLAPEDAEDKTKSDKIWTLVQNNCTLFRDQYNEPFAEIEDEGITKVVAVNSEWFRLWALDLYCETFNESIAESVVRECQARCKAKAAKKQDHRIISVRIAKDEEDICIDLANDDWKYIRITKTGWFIDNHKTLFVRYNHQKSHPEPVPNGNLQEIFNIIPIRSPVDRILFLGSLMAGFVPNIPHAIMNFLGDHGSAKSMTSRVVKMMIDPSALKLTAIPDDEKEFFLLCNQHWLIPFDNVSKAPDYFSDAACRTVTGDGYARRKLYSDADLVVFETKKIICVNGISPNLDKPDFLDRSIIIYLERIEEEDRLMESEFYDKFEEMRPRLLGAICTTLMKAMSIVPNIRKEFRKLPRMADWATWGEACCQAAGYASGAFFAAYQHNMRTKHELIAEQNTFLNVLLRYLDTNTVNGYDGSMGDLYRELCAHANEMGVNPNDRYSGFPSQPNWLGRKLRDVKVTMKEIGWKIEFTRSELHKLVSIKKLPVMPVMTITNFMRNNDDKNAGNAGNASTSFCQEKEGKKKEGEKDTKCNIEVTGILAFTGSRTNIKKTFLADALLPVNFLENAENFNIALKNAYYKTDIRDIENNSNRHLSENEETDKNGKIAENASDLKEPLKKEGVKNGKKETEKEITFISTATQDTHYNNINRNIDITPMEKNLGMCDACQKQPDNGAIAYGFALCHACYGHFQRLFVNDSIGAMDYLIAAAKAPNSPTYAFLQRLFTKKFKLTADMVDKLLDKAKAKGEIIERPAGFFQSMDGKK